MTAAQITVAIETDKLFREAYGEDWERVRGSRLFWTGYRFEEPSKILSWEWSNDFGRWGASVEFTEGQRMFTYPKYEMQP